jgi:hypothetical protein
MSQLAQMQDERSETEAGWRYIDLELDPVLHERDCSVEIEDWPENRGRDAVAPQFRVLPEQVIGRSLGGTDSPTSSIVAVGSNNDDQ